MKRNVILACLLLACSQFLQAQLKPVQLTCEYLKNHPVIDVLNPRLSWINLAKEEERGQIQSAWEIRVASNPALLDQGKPDMWSSGKVASGKSTNVVYKGKALLSRQDCWWQVRVWNKDGKVSEWSETASWSMGLLKPGEWKAIWIGAPWQGEDPIPDSLRPLTASRAKDGEKITEIQNLNFPPPAPMLRKEFEVKKELVSAKAYVSGLGYFELYLNGRKVGNDVLVPNMTNYGKRPGLMEYYIPIPDDFTEYRVMYLSYDLTGSLSEGKNVIGAIVGNGFYNAPINWTASYGTPRFIGQIHLKYKDGTEEVIVSDQSWKASKSPILMDLLFDGEHYDARMEQKGWCTAGFDAGKWQNAVVRKTPEGKMKAQMAHPDRVMETLDPIKIERLGEGHFKVDFGQEISGWVHLSGIKGEAGRKIDIKYVHKTPSGDNSYTLSGNGSESYAARFTWFVFREAEIINWPGELKPEQIKAEVVYTDTETTGRFECSDTLLNKINRIWWRSQTDNMHGGVASDCPNRERAPYTGDGQVACVTVMHNFDVRAFYNKWIHDITGAQIVGTGYVPNGAPWQPGCGGGVAWGSAISIMPWEFYVHYGDIDILKDSYDGMKGYIKYMLTWTDKDGIMFSQVPGLDGKPNKWMNLGEWSQPFELPPDDLVHTFYLWRCADMTSKTANALGRKEEAKEYSLLAERTREAFMKKFYDDKKGTYGPNGGNIFALRIGVPADKREKVIEALRSDIKANGGHLDTGIFGTQFFFEVLSENGLHELAYEAMSKRTLPSYGWWIVEQGATTSWEDWDRPGSGNHPMFGGGLVWLYRKLAGMDSDPQKPGYEHVIFKPQPVNQVSYAEYSNLTSYGECGISWKKSNGKFLMSITVPVGSTATAYVPATGSDSVLEGGKTIDKASGITFLKMDNGYAVYEVGSGRYEFQSEVK